MIMFNLQPHKEFESNKKEYKTVKKSKVALGLVLGLGIATFAFADNAEAAQNMHRMYNPNSGEHFYTANVGEKDNLIKHGWRYEGIGWVAPDTGANVYRLYNPNSGDHHYTTGLNEKNNLVKVGWRYEGVGWKSDTYKGVGLHRLYNPNAKTGTHHYTTGTGERDHLAKLGWRKEGIGWYGMNPNQKFNIKVVHKGSDGKVLNEQTVAVKRDTNYKASSKTFSGYTLKGSSTQTVKADGNKTVTFNYTKNTTPVVQKYTITVIHKGSDGMELKKTTATVEKGKQYTAKAEAFKGYNLQGNNSQTITVNGNQTITFNYKRDGVSKEEKKELQALYDKVKNTQKGNYTDASWAEFQKQLTTAKTVLDSDSVNLSTVIYAQMQLQKAYDNLVVNAPVEKFNITINYQDTAGNILETAKGIQVEKGKQYTATAKTIAGYTLQGNSTQTITVNNHTTITFTYKKNQAPVEKYNVVVVHKGNDGKILQTENAVSVEKGKTFTGYAKTFSGYTLSGNSSQTITINGNATMTFTYNKNVAEDLTTIENQINNQALVNINSHRSKNGKASIKYNSILQQASTIRSRELAVKFDHKRPNGSDSSTVAESMGYDKLHWNENIYMGSGMSLDWIKTNGASLIVNAWINSSGHNATLLSEKDIEGAVGVYIKDNGNGSYNLYASYLPGESLFG